MSNEYSKHSFPTPPESLCYKDPYVAIGRYRGSRSWVVLSPTLVFRNHYEAVSYADIRQQADPRIKDTGCKPMGSVEPNVALVDGVVQILRQRPQRGPFGCGPFRSRPTSRSLSLVRRAPLFG